MIFIDWNKSKALPVWWG